MVIPQRAGTEHPEVGVARAAGCLRFKPCARPVPEKSVLEWCGAVRDKCRVEGCPEAGFGVEGEHTLCEIEGRRDGTC